MTLIRSILFGYLGAVLGGLLVAVVALPLDASLTSVAEAATVAGAVFGMLGLMLAWRRATPVPAAQSKQRR